MAPALRLLVDLSRSIAALPLASRDNIQAYITSKYANTLTVSRQPNVNTANPAVAKAIIAKFQGFNNENYQACLIYQLALAAGLSTDGPTLNNIVVAAWGGPNGVVGAQPALTQYGTLNHLGSNLQAMAALAYSIQDDSTDIDPVLQFSP